MFDESNYFIKTTYDKEKLLNYGFVLKDGYYSYKASFSDKNLSFIINIGLNKIQTTVYDNLNNCEYLLFKIKNTLGDYNVKIKNEYDAFLKDIKEKCFVKQLFKEIITNQLIDYALKRYPIKLDYPFESDICVLRSLINQKWIGIIMLVQAKKLLKNKDETLIEIINLKVAPEIKDWLLKKDNIYPSYHMNKKYWISVILNNNIDLELLKFLLDESYQEVNKNR